MIKITQLSTKVLKGFKTDDLEDVIYSLFVGYDKTVNVGAAIDPELGDVHLESTTAYAARFIQACIDQGLVK